MIEMTIRGRPPKGLKLDDLPENLRFSIIKLMAQLKVKDVTLAFDLAASFIDRNCDEFKKLVSAEAERRYRSRHLTELNKARATIENANYNRGYQIGYRDAKKKYRIWYFCDVCGGELEMLPNSNDHVSMMGYMKEKGWRHTKCQ